MSDIPVQSNFRQQVYAIVASIPEGKLMTYGDVAACCGQAYAARIVGGIAHFGPIDLPWQRVVNRFGGLASGYPGGREGHKRDLEREGMSVNSNFIVEDFEKRRWRPDQPALF